MDKQKIEELFNELLNEYRIAEETCIDNMGKSSEHEILKKEIAKYKERLSELL